MRVSFLSSVACFAVLSFQSCSTLPPEPNGRQGLLGDLASRNPTATHTVKSRAVVSSRQVSPQGDIILAGKKANLHWPLARVEVTSPFGQRTRDFHEGIDLRASVGTPVFAAQSGTVIYSGSRIRGYGKMIVIQHRAGIATVYAHASRLLVRRGQKVKLGQKIADSGKSGRATGPHLHFEVRRGVVAVNPADFLPRSKLSQAEPSPLDMKVLAAAEKSP